jgi:hypothetical protein
MEVAVSTVTDIRTAPGFKQVALSATFADDKGSVLHRIDFSTRVQALPSDTADVVHRRAVEQAKLLAKEFSA